MEESKPSRPVSKERISKLYWDSGLNQKQISDVFGVSQATISDWMKQYDIPTRGGSQSIGARFLTHTSGYENWLADVDGTTKTVAVHQLLAIAEGEDPSKVFSDGEYQIHHKNEIPWDNRAENIELVTRQEHADRHPERGYDRMYTDEELCEWIGAFVNEFGVVPARDDISGWPGPSAATYTDRFGSWTKAVKAAGYTPRSEQ